MARPRILIIEPYFGGSHRRFIEGLQQHVDADYLLLSLPARKWKMRMQLAAPWFAARLREEERAGRCFDAVLCSSFVDLAVLRVLLSQLPGWRTEARFCLYFHENQLAYPERGAAPSRQFAALNYTSALAADRIAFNSVYNADSFLAGCRAYLRQAVDQDVMASLTDIERKSVVLYPGIDFGPIDAATASPGDGTPVVVWNHRWEHDKNPDEFCRAVQLLYEEGLQFRLILLGQSFKTKPACLAELAADHRLFHCGFVPSEDAYARLLRTGTHVVSTAFHEFFGMAVLEAVRAGCQPLLPNRLVYPELYPAEHLYPEGEFTDRLRQVLTDRHGSPFDPEKRYTEAYSWPRIAENYRRWLLDDSWPLGSVPTLGPR